MFKSAIGGREAKMIDPHCFTSEWIHQQRDQLQRVDPTLLEKTILAFELLGQLAMCDLSFVFKGGTCLLLLLDDFKRLSIDVDIVSEQDEQQFQAVSPQAFYYWYLVDKLLSS